jgi:hypothetical protein
MNRLETTELLKQISAVDNRKVNEETVTAWQAIMSNIPFDIAKEALVLARKDDRITYLEPRHIVSWAREAAFKLDRETGRNTPEEPQGNFIAQPKCKHDKGILDCLPCCRELKPLADRSKNEILIEAKKRIYS